MAFRYPVRIYFSDTDAGGIVYHARYLDFAEHARTELLRTITSEESIQNRLLSARIGFIVKALSIEYHLPAYLDDLLEVETTIESSKRFSLTFLQQIYRGAELITTLHVRVGCINIDTKTIQPIDPALADAMNAR